VSGRRTTSAVTVLIALAVGAMVTSCADRQAGTPTAQSSTSAATVGTQQPTTTSTRASDVPADPCVLLSTSEVTQLGYTGPGETSTANGARSCAWSKPDGSLEVRTSPRGINELNVGSATTVTPVTVGSHTGLRVEEVNSAVGDCSISLAVTDRSSVTVGVFMAGKTAQACAQAEQAARLVEPKLPRG